LRCGHQAANLLDGERQDYALIPTVIRSTFIIIDVISDSDHNYGR
jgi:hypothetical protein